MSPLHTHLFPGMIAFLIAVLAGCTNTPPSFVQGGSDETVIGYVYNADNSLAAGVVVRLYKGRLDPLNAYQEPIGSDTTGDDGRYEFRDLRRNHRVTVVGTGIDSAKGFLLDGIRPSTDIRKDTLAVPDSVFIRIRVSEEGLIDSAWLRVNEDSSFSVDRWFYGALNLRPERLYRLFIESVADSSINRWETLVTRQTLIDWVLAHSTDDLRSRIRLPLLQEEFLALRFGMMVSFNMSTFQRGDCPECYSVMGEWVTSRGDSINRFDPTALDCGQWMRAAQAAGCTYVVLTVKHHDGFCLWPSAYSENTVARTAWGESGRDIVKEFVDSARVYGLQPGLYYSMWDRTNGNDSVFVKNQLGELLDTAVYGRLLGIWFTGWSWQVGYRRIPYTSIRRLVKSLQPDCLLIEGNYFRSLDSTEIMSYVNPVLGPVPSGNRIPAENLVPLRSDSLWFWHPRNACAMKSASEVVAGLGLSVQSNCNYLLDVTPDTTGTIPECMVSRMREIGELLIR